MTEARPLPQRAAIALLALAALSIFTAATLDLVAGADVTLLHNAKDAAEQAEWRRLRDPRDDPAEIYGQPDGPPLRVLVFDAARVITPAEAPELRLLALDRASGDVPLQTRTLWRYALTLAVPCLGLAGVLALAARRRAHPERTRARPRGSAAGPLP